MAVGLILAATAIGVQMKAKHEEGKAEERRLKDEAAWQEYNAKIAEREAKEVQTAAAFEERAQRKAGARLKARRITQAGQAGIEPIGSFEKVQEETTTELEIDALTIRRGGETGAQRLTAEASLSRLSGRSALLRGRAARRAGRIGAISTGLRGGSQLAFKATE